MPKRESVESFVSLVELGKFDLAIELYYAEDASMQESLDPPHRGVATLVYGERCVMSQFSKIEARRVGPVFIDGDNVVVRWNFEFSDGKGKRHSLDEVSYQRWTGEHIAEERFYYDPVQMRA
jgi:hypothetical protein